MSSLRQRLLERFQKLKRFNRDLEVTVPQAARRLREDPPPLLLDVREEEELRQTGVIEGAHWVPLGQLTGERIGQLTDRDNPEIIVYCATGSRSWAAAEMLQNAGWEKARSLAEGIDEWAERGLPLQRWEQS